MNELHLEYQKETGIQIGHTVDRIYTISGVWLDLEDATDLTDYIEWLEEKLLDDEALFVLMNKILHEKNKGTEPPIPGADE